MNDADISIVVSTGTGKTASFLTEILATKLNKYYDKTTGTLVNGAPDPPNGRPDFFKIAVRAMKAHRLGSVVESTRTIKVTVPRNFGALDVRQWLRAEGADVVEGIVPLLPTLQLWNTQFTILPSQVAPPEPPCPAKVEYEWFRQVRDLERRARILLRRLLHVRVRRVRTATVPVFEKVDHSTESHRSRAPAWRTSSSPVFRALAAV
ncbi:MAG: hypothetical protein ACRDSE_00445 [Pseudonocardiaceae bacterium]